MSYTFKEVLSRRTKALHPPSIIWNEKFNTPEVNQREQSGITLSWNPDDDRFYVSEQSNDHYLGSFKDFRNAVTCFNKATRHLES